MQIEKTCVLPVPIQHAWDCLADADLVGACVPGVEKVERVDDTHFLVTVTVKVGVIKPTFRLNVTLVEQRPPNYLRSTCVGEANGMMGSLRQTTQIRLSKIHLYQRQHCSMQPLLGIFQTLLLDHRRVN